MREFHGKGTAEVVATRHPSLSFSESSYGSCEGGYVGEPFDCGLYGAIFI